MSVNREMTADLVREIFRYEPESGKLFWNISPTRSVRAGAEAGRVSWQGRVEVGFSGRKYIASRLVWLYVTGEWPMHEIDHINQNPLDNRIANLRDIPRAQNQQNISRAQSNSKSGIRGVVRRGDKWAAIIMLRKKQTYLGMFDTPHEAEDAYRSAKRKIHKSWAFNSDTTRRA